MTGQAIVLQGDARSLVLPDESVDLIVTSPPYFGLRSYTDGGEHYDGQIGSEATPAEWLAAMLECTAEWVRVPEAVRVDLRQPRRQVRSRRPMVAPGRARRASPRHCAGRRHGATRRRTVRRPVEPPEVSAGPAVAVRAGLHGRPRPDPAPRHRLVQARNGLPESVTDRCRSSHGYASTCVKQPRYYAAVDEIREAHTGDAHGSSTATSRWVVSIGERNAERARHGGPAQTTRSGELPGSCPATLP